MAGVDADATRARSLRQRVVGRLEDFDRSDLTLPVVPPLWPRTVSRSGEVIGVLFASLALFPSMLPKNGFIQGVVVGITFIVGYALGVAWQWMWRFLELPTPTGALWRVVVGAWYAIVLALLVSNLWRHVGWQNSVREAFGMEPISPIGWLIIVPVGGAVAALLLIVGRSLRRLFHLVVGRLDRRLPQRLARLLGGVVFVLLVGGLWSQVLVDGFFAAANWLSAPVDASTDEGISPPLSELRSGSPASLVTWETLGRQGRKFVATGPTADELTAFSGTPALEPIRVYVGLKSAQTLEERADLILRELVRTDAFDRDVLVIVSTTGTGLVDLNAMRSLEYVTNGDVAVAGVQYSYLPSPVSLLGDADEVRQTSQTVFEKIHEHWSRLPENSRPEIYLYGLSLGSLGVESILTSIDIINEPIDGALMVGPPFVDELRNRVVSERDAGTTPAAPIYDHGRTVRFADEQGVIADGSAVWGDTRLLYLQHATDPVVYFSPDLLLQRPDWLDSPQRSPEINRRFTWIPFVTMWQVLTDLAVANAVPPGHGHVYTADAHASAWVAVTRPDGWTEADTDALRAHLDDEG